MEFQVSEPKPFESLADGLKTLIHCLQMHVPLRVWMVTRVTGNDWNVLHVSDRDGALHTGDVVKWSDSYCSRMVKGETPRFAPNVASISEYRTAGINDLLEIGCYIGQPLRASDGTLLGTLCAIDPLARSDFSPEQKILVETVARTICTLISGYMNLEQARQKQAELHYRAETDSLTGLSNRHAWKDALNAEELALESLGENAMVLMVDLDGLKLTNDTLGHDAGDQYLRKAAAVLREQFREADVLARIGGDEFAILARGVSSEEAARIKERLALAFDCANVHASVGFAMRLSHRNLKEALRAADRKMYEEKNQRQRKGADI